MKLYQKILVGIFFCTAPLIAHAEPVNCNDKVLSRVEHKICDNEELKLLDERFNKFYQMIKFTKDGQEFDKANPEWQLERSRCFTETCIKNLYNTLIGKTMEVLLEQNPRFKQMQEECSALAIPPECEVYAYDANYAGGGLNIDFAEFAIDENYETHVKSIKVNRPNKCVVLALSSFEPTLWKIYYTPQTQIYGVILAYDDENQMLQGVPVGTKVWRNECLKKSVAEAYMSGLANNNVIELKNAFIGEELPNTSYMHQARNIDVNVKIQQELPNHEAVKALVKAGVLRPIDQKDVGFLIDRGYSPINAWLPVNLSDWKRMYEFRCSDERGRYISYECNHYILEKPLAKLPRGLDGVYGIIVFVPDGMTPPEKSSTTSTIMRMHSSLKELNEFRREN